MTASTGLRPRVHPAPTVAALAGLAASASALGVAPVLMPDDYSWTTHTTSESAAQGVPGAWLARLGLLLFGLSVLLLASVLRRRWGALAAGAFCTFGGFLAASAAFSTRPWWNDAVFDRTEDLLHSVAATAMGFAFAIGVVAVLIVDRSRGRGRRVLGALAVVASVVLPLGMTVWPDAAGVLQRAMFVVAYAWFATEAAGVLARSAQSGS